MKHFKRLFFVLLTLALVACAAPTVDPSTPPEIVYGEDVCDRCGMIINDERFAASVVVETAPKEYEHLLFDDIGDMFAYTQEEGEHVKIVSYFVHDFNSKAWLDARSANFVKAGSLQTPMGFGLAAFAERAEAEIQAQTWQGEVLDFQQASQESTEMEVGHMHSD